MDDTDASMTGVPQPLEQPANGSLPAGSPGSSADASSCLQRSPSEELRPGSRQQRTVPYGALAEERARRKELQRELQTAVEAQQRLQGRLDLLHELARQHGGAEQAEGAAEPEPGDRDQLQETKSEPLSATAAETQADAVLRTDLMRSVRDVMRARPDFLAAYQHARQARVSELRALGYAPYEAVEITFDNEAEVIRNAYANGRNPAQVIYEYAQRHGYRGAPSREPAQGDRAIPPHQRAPMSEADKVALAARGQAASKSLSAAGGGSTGVLTLEALAGLSDEEFAEATKGDRWQKLLR
jgi:hypothetical protein